MTDELQGWTYFGGPLDGEPVELEPGWPAPDEISHVGWSGHYRQMPEQKRYEWTEQPLPGRSH